MEVVLKVSKQDDGTFEILPTSANSYFLKLAEAQGKSVPTTSFNPREYPQIRCLDAISRELHVQIAR